MPRRLSFPAGRLRLRVMWDLFCSVVDNFGDVGVSWRLARSLRAEHGVPVRLWIDDLHAYARLDQGADPEAAVQLREGVEVRAWRDPFPGIEPGEVVIEAFGCQLPPAYVEAMARKARPPVWINLEYLSAEDWVRGCHGLPSPHPRLPLVKHFFFPGFEAGTGGLLRERDLGERRTAFQNDAAQQRALWAKLGLPAPAPGERRVSLFCYDNPALAPLFDAWAEGEALVTCLVPEGAILRRVAAYFECGEVRAGQRFARGRLGVAVLPFSDQPDYDRLLWACDLNLVRGEDSFVRAQWAARPLVWHIYPQEGGAHFAKLEAFLERYCAGMPAGLARATRALHAAWNGVHGAPDAGSAWQAWSAQWEAARQHAERWAVLREQGPELAAELVKFVQAQVK